MTAMTTSMTKTMNSKITYSLEELMQKDEKQSQRRERSVNLSSLKSPGTPGRSKKKVQRGSSSRKLQDEGYNSDGVLSKKKNELRSKNKGASKHGTPPSPPPPPPPETPPPGTPKTPRSRKTPKQMRRGSGGTLIGGSKAAVDEGTGYSSDGAMSKRKSELRWKLQAEKEARQGQTPSRRNSGSSDYKASPRSNAASRKRAVLRKVSNSDDDVDNILKSPGGIRNSPRIVAGQKIRRTSTTKSNDEDENLMKSPGVAGWKAKRPSINKTKSISTEGSELTVKSMPTNILGDSPHQQKSRRGSSLFKKTPSNRNMDGEGSDHRPSRQGSQRKGMDAGSDHRSRSRSRSRPNMEKIPSNRRITNKDRSTSPAQGRSSSRSRRRTSSNDFDGPGSNHSRDNGQPSRTKRSGMKRDGRRLGDVKNIETQSTGTISLSTNTMSTADSDEETMSEDEAMVMNSRPKFHRAVSTSHLNSDISDQGANNNDAAKIQKKMKKLVDDNVSLRRENQKLLARTETLEDRLNEERLKSFALTKGADNTNDDIKDKSNEGSDFSDLRRKIEELEEANKQLKLRVAEMGTGDAEVDKMSRPQLIDELYQTKKFVSERDSKISRQNVELEQLRNTTIQQATKYQEEKQDQSVEREEMESQLKSKDDTIQHLMSELEKLKLGGNSVHSQGAPYKRFSFAR